MCALKLRSKGKKVMRLQEKLKKTGYDPGESDGYFGYKTLESVASLREDLHLPPTGEVDRQLYSHLKLRKNFGGVYYREDGVLKRKFTPLKGALGYCQDADFTLSFIKDEQSDTKVFLLEDTTPLVTRLFQIRKHSFYIAFHSLKGPGQKKAQVLTLGRKAKGFIYLPWEQIPKIDKPILIEDIPKKLEEILRDLYWKDLYLAIPLMAFEWVIEPEKTDEAVRHSGKFVLQTNGKVLDGYPKEQPYDETIDFLRKRGQKGRKIDGDFYFQYNKNRLKTVIKVLSPGEIERLISLCDEYRLSGVVFWKATLGEDRLREFS